MEPGEELLCLQCGARPEGFRPSMSKRHFLISQGINKRYSLEEKAPVIAYALKHGINAAYKKFGFPRSTVGMWMNGRSPYPRNKDKYTTRFKKIALGLFQETRSKRLTADIMGMPRSTLQNWLNAGSTA